MKICCLDLEGVLVPEVWIEVAKKTGIHALKLTTRDVSDYDRLMKYRLKILKQHSIKLRDIQEVIGKIRPLEGAKNFLDVLRTRQQVIILSDTYYEFAAPLMKQLGHPTLFCNFLSVDRRGFVANYHLRQKNGKAKAVLSLKRLGFCVAAVGDSYNDLTMLKIAHQGILFNPPEKIRRENPGFRVAKDYRKLLGYLSDRKRP